MLDFTVAAVSSFWSALDSSGLRLHLRFVDCVQTAQ